MNYNANDFYNQLESNAVNRLEILKKAKKEIEIENKRIMEENKRIIEENRKKLYEYSDKLADYYVQIAMLASEALMNSANNKLELDKGLISSDISQYLKLNKAKKIVIDYDSSAFNITIDYMFDFYPYNGTQPDRDYEVYSFDIINEILKANNFDIIVSIKKSDIFAGCKEETWINIKCSDKFLSKYGMSLPKKTEKILRREYKK